MRNNKLIIIWMIVLLLLIGVGIFAFAWKQHFNENTNKAIAVVQNGEASVVAVDGTPYGFEGQREINVGETIVTRDAEVLLTINGDFFVWVKKNSRLALKAFNETNIDVSLDNGAAWYMHVNSSSSQQFMLETPLTKTIPDGTKLFVTYDATNDESTTLLVQGSAIVKDEFSSIELSPVEKTLRTENNGLRIVELSSDDKQIVNSQLQKDYAILLAARMQEISKYGVALNIIKGKYNLSDKNIEGVIQQIDRGEVSVDDLIKRSPVPIPNIDRLLAFTNEAKQTLSVQKDFANSINSTQ